MLYAIFFPSGFVWARKTVVGVGIHPRGLTVGQKDPIAFKKSF
jgi:hypothetical protein